MESSRYLRTISYTEKSPKKAINGFLAARTAAGYGFDFDACFLLT